MDCSTAGLSVPPEGSNLPKFVQVHVHCIRMPSSHSSSDALFFCPQSFPASGTFPMNPLFSSDNQNTGASASVLPVNTQGWSPLRLTGLISLLSKGLSGVFSCTAVQRNRFFGVLPSLWRSSHNLYMTTGKTIALTIWTFVGRVISVCNQLQLQNYICCLSWMFPGLTSIWLTLYFLLSWTSAYTMAPLSVHMKYKE